MDFVQKIFEKKMKNVMGPIIGSGSYSSVFMTGSAGSGSKRFHPVPGSVPAKINWFVYDCFMDVC